MKILWNLLLVSAAGALWAADDGSQVRSAESPSPAGEMDFVLTTLGAAFQVEWACFTGVMEHLDGPAREGMGRQMGGSSTQGCLRGMQSDSSGNLYMCDMTSGMLRALRKRDGMLLTLSGNGHMTTGRPPEKEGPAYRLCLDQLVYIAAVGEPLEGKGSLYLTTEDVVVRLFRNEKAGGIWWYERVAGGGKKAITVAQKCDAAEVSLNNPRVFATKEGKIGVLRPVGGGKDIRQILFWLENDKLVPAYDDEALHKSEGAYFSCYGVDGAGNIAGCSGNTVVAIAADGKTVKHKVAVPFPLSWGAYPDQQRECWFVKGMDHYTVTVVTPAGKTGTLKDDGGWHVHQEGMGARGYNLNNGLQWMWCLPLQDGRMVGWNSHGCLPLFVGTWLEKGGMP